MGDAPRLKPMVLAEILDAAFRLYRENFATFLGILSVAYVPFFLVQMALTAFLMPEGARPFQVQEGATPEQIQEALRANKHLIQAGVILGVVNVIFLGLIAHPLATGALTHAVGCRYLNEPASLGKSYGAIARVFFRYLGTILLSGLVVGLGFMFCFVPGFFFWTWFLFVSQIVVLENLGGTRAMGRSRDLVRGYAWRVLGYALLTTLLAAVVGGMLGAGWEFAVPFITDSLPLRMILNQALQQGIQIVVMPYFTVVLILLYYDLRVRKEAFDLEVLSDSLVAGKAKPPLPG